MASRRGRELGPARDVDDDGRAFGATLLVIAVAVLLVVFAGGGW